MTPRMGIQAVPGLWLLQTLLPPAPCTCLSEPLSAQKWFCWDLGCAHDRVLLIRYFP